MVPKLLAKRGLGVVEFKKGQRADLRPNVGYRLGICRKFFTPAAFALQGQSHT